MTDDKNELLNEFLKAMQYVIIVLFLGAIGGGLVQIKKELKSVNANLVTLQLLKK